MLTLAVLLWWLHLLGQIAQNYLDDLREEMDD